MPDVRVRARVGGRDVAMTVADLVAEFFEARGCRHAFGVVGAGNMRVFDAIARRGYTHVICTHSEQAAAQAAIGYFRVRGQIAPVLVTCGGGASNVVTGVVSAWMDSIPLFVVAGQESRRNHKLRAFGVQGFDLLDMLHRQTKGRWMAEKGACLQPAWDAMIYRRPGPVVIEIPMDVQGQQV